jgi:GNAT superfamily N-acetyltransferase
MPDMLVKLYTLPTVTPLLDELHGRGIIIRQALATERYVVSAWVRQQFGESWAVAAEVASERTPGSCYIAVERDLSHTPSHPYDVPPETLLGFACFDTDIKGMFGPIGVHEEYRGRGIGKALLLTSLHAMAAAKYAYAIIGWVGPAEFYSETVGATLIEGSEPGIFGGLLRP